MSETRRRQRHVRRHHSRQKFLKRAKSRRHIAGLGAPERI